MSSVGFSQNGSKDYELEAIREAWRSLNDVLRNIRNAEASLKTGEFKLVASHLGVAKWNIDQVKKAITFVGQSKTKRPADQPSLR